MFLSPPVSRASAQPVDYQQLAQRIITTSVQVKPGEVVVITGGKHTIPLMEALAIEAQKAGGLSQILLISDKVVRSQYMDVPDKYLSTEPRYFAQWLKQADVFITLPPTSDIRALDAGASARRLGLINKSNDFMTPLLDRMKFRELDITYPTPERGRSFRLSGPTYVNMIFAAMGADYASIAARGAALKMILQHGKHVHVTSPNGTDFSFSLGQRPVPVTAGVITGEMAKGQPFIHRDVTLPDGLVQVAPIENSANGKVVVSRAACRFEVMSDISFTFSNGVAKGLRVMQGRKCFDELQKASGGPVNTLGSFTIGLNPAWKPHEENGAAYFPGDDAGGVTVGIGDNELLGGSNKTLGAFAFPFYIKNATVTVDGKKIVEGGKLVL